MELVVIIETWFFRHPETFAALARLVNARAAGHRDKIVRILSAPCATGEEPYTIVMALLDAGISPGRFQVDAMDISAGALARARRAVYGKNSFRGAQLDFRKKYFLSFEHAHRVNPDICRRVNFMQGNLLDPVSPWPAGTYDFILCRNLLIYFDDATRKNLLSRLRYRLSANGVLFLGPAEVPLALANGFVAGDLPRAFGCVPAPLPPPTVTRINFTQPGPGITFKVTSSPAGPALAVDTLERARQLAEDGRLDEAAAICEAHLREYGASAEAYFLLGLVQRSAGADTQAAECYRRALYLEPTHYDTLVQWAALSNQRGDKNRSRLLGRRAERVKPRK